MPKEIILFKLDQIGRLVDSLEKLLAKPWPEFKNDEVVIRAAERDFQLIIDVASDINGQMILERGGKIPDTYKQSFSELGKLGLISDDLSVRLSNAAGVRNVLVHEYDIDEDYEKFYQAAKDSISTFREYLKVIHSGLK